MLQKVFQLSFKSVPVFCGLRKYLLTKPSQSKFCPYLVLKDKSFLRNRSFFGCSLSSSLKTVQLFVHGFTCVVYQIPSILWKKVPSTILVWKPVLQTFWDCRGNILRRFEVDYLRRPTKPSVKCRPNLRKPSPKAGPVRGTDNPLWQRPIKSRNANLFNGAKGAVIAWTCQFVSPALQNHEIKFSSAMHLSSKKKNFPCVSIYLTQNYYTRAMALVGLSKKAFCWIKRVFWKIPVRYVN